MNKNYFILGLLLILSIGFVNAGGGSECTSSLVSGCTITSTTLNLPSGTYNNRMIWFRTSVLNTDANTIFSTSNAAIYPWRFDTTGSNTITGTVTSNINMEIYSNSVHPVIHYSTTNPFNYSLKGFDFSDLRTANFNWFFNYTNGSKAFSLEINNGSIGDSGSINVASTNYVLLGDDTFTSFSLPVFTTNNIASLVITHPNTYLVTQVVITFYSGSTNVILTEGSDYTILSDTEISIHPDDYGADSLKYVGSVTINTPIPCVEFWTQNTPTSCDGLISNYTILYTDENTCGTISSLPVDNGTIENCCVENWQRKYTTCDNKERVMYYEDDNNCATSYTQPINVTETCGGGSTSNTITGNFISTSTENTNELITKEDVSTDSSIETSDNTNNKSSIIENIQTFFIDLFDIIIFWN